MVSGPLVAPTVGKGEMEGGESGLPVIANFFPPKIKRMRKEILAIYLTTLYWPFF